MPARSRTAAGRTRLRSPRLITQALPFAPTAALLAAAVDELADLGTASGGAVADGVRGQALAAYRAFGRERRVTSRWRHPYDALTFDDLAWSSGRLRVPATERATGLAHAGATYLEPSTAAGDPRITLSNLADAARKYADDVAQTHGRLIAFETDRFTALSTAFQNCGAYVAIPDGVVLEDAIPIVWTTRPGMQSAVFAHTVVRLGAGARATLVERHLGEGDAFVANVVEADLGPGARLDYVIVQQADDGTRAIVRRAARCADGASVGWHLADLGGALCRSVFDVPLASDGARAAVNALFFAMGYANVDCTVDVAHVARDTESATVVRSVAKDLGIGRFAGNVRIGPSAHRTRASLRADALVLSRDAYVEAIPALEIENNDVIASHAATVGSLDEEQLFYAQSRGIDRSRAERMVALAFFEPALAGFPTEILRDEVRAALDARLDEVPDTFS